VHEAVVVRLSRFRASRPGFDAVLRATVLPALRAQGGLSAVFAGRQGPDETGARALVTLWASTSSLHEGPREDVVAPDAPAAEMTDQRVETLPALLVALAATPLTTGILRIARGRLVDTDLASFAELVRRESAGLQAAATGHDFVMAASGESSFVMISTWADWAAIEAATGASLSEPIHTKRLAALEDFVVEHYELVTERTRAD
jgi:hypothetical protein